jgi:hypothetical protein
MGWLTGLEPANNWITTSPLAIWVQPPYLAILPYMGMDLSKILSFASVFSKYAVEIDSPPEDLELPKAAGRVHELEKTANFGDREPLLPLPSFDKPEHIQEIRDFLSEAVHGASLANINREMFNRLVDQAWEKRHTEPAGGFTDEKGEWHAVYPEGEDPNERY